MTADVAGRRILIVEDEVIIAMSIESVLREQGCVIVGPAARVDRALELARSERLDAALLDIGLRGEAVFPVADALATRGVPFAFLSGYELEGMPSEHRDRPVLTKPDLLDALLATLGMLIATSHGGMR